MGVRGVPSAEHPTGGNLVSTITNIILTFNIIEDEDGLVAAVMIRFDRRSP